MHKSLASASLSMEKVANELRRTIEKQERLGEFVGSIETAGICRKYGGVIEVNYVKFLNNIGAVDEAELERTIKERKGGKVASITRKKGH